MAESAIERALRRRKGLQDTVRDAMQQLAEVTKFIKTYSNYAAADDPMFTEGDTGSMGRAGTGMSQQVFEELLTIVIRDLRRPVHTSEIIAEFRERGHPIGGLNEVKAAWNRLWAAKKNGVIIAVDDLGYWFPDEPIPEDVDSPSKPPRGALSNPRRYAKKKRGAPPLLTPGRLRIAEAMLKAGRSMKDVAAELGGLSEQALYRHFPGGAKAVLQKEKDDN